MGNVLDVNFKELRVNITSNSIEVKTYPYSGFMIIENRFLPNDTGFKYTESNTMIVPDLYKAIMRLQVLDWELRLELCFRIAKLRVAGE